MVTTSRERSRAQGRVRWELLVGLVRKDLKVKYQGSVLGFLWSLANPLLLLVVYTFVFQVVLSPASLSSASTCCPACWCGTCSPARWAPRPPPWSATRGW